MRLPPLLSALLVIAPLYALGTKSDTKKITDNYCQKVKAEQFCMDYSVTYPVVRTGDPRLDDTINATIAKHIPRTDARAYITDYLSDNGEFFGSPGHSDETEITLLSLTPRTFTLTVSNSSYTGGAHGNFGSVSYNYDRENGRILTFDDLFGNENNESVRAIAERHYRQSEGMMPGEELTTTQGWFNNEFILSQSIAVGEDGLHLDYNPYEIKPYAAGSTQIVVPYAKLAPLIAEGSYLAPMLRDTGSLPEESGHISRSFTDDYSGRIDIDATLLAGNRVELTVTAKNLTDYTTGGISLSFPELYDEFLLLERDRGDFKDLTLYPVGSRLFYVPTRKTIRSRYLLLEGDSKGWRKGVSKSFTVVMQMPRGMSELYINARTAFRQQKDIISMPSYGAEDQQGFANYRMRVPLRGSAR